MLISVICDQCQKHYKVDSKLGGRKVKCRACGHPIPIPVSEPQAGMTDDLMAGLKAAALAETAARPGALPDQASGHGVRTSHPPPGARPAPGARDLPPVAHQAGVPTGGRPVERCPSCGAALPPTANFCATCGFKRAGGQRPPTAARPAPRPNVRRPLMSAGLDEPERDSLGVRYNRPYKNVILNFIDTWVPVAAIWITLLLFAVNLSLPWIDYFSDRSAWGMTVTRLVGLSMVNVVMAALYCGITLRITIFGVASAGKFMKFEIPENTYGRLFATFLIPMFLIVSVLVLMQGGLGLIPPKYHQQIAGLMAIIWMVTVALFFVTSFFSFMFFFRLKFLESFLGYVLMIVYYFFGMLTLGVLILAVVFIIAMIYKLRASMGISG